MSDTFKYETVQDVATLLPYLDAIKEGLQSGHLTLAGRKHTLELFPEGMVTFSLEGKSKEGKHRLAFKITWHDPALDADLPDDMLTIQAR
ncbi:MAG: amphi-Trp domain-containing protein [Desulfovibrionaceae bacterium]